MIKVTDLEYLIFIAFTLKFGVKSVLSEGSDTSWGIREPLLTCSSWVCFGRIKTMSYNQRNTVWIYMHILSV